MSNFSKFVGVVGVATLLTACGGGGGDGKPSNVPKDELPPSELSKTFVPFKDKDFLTKLSEALKFTESPNATDDNYNKALGHMIGEALGDAPITRTARVVQLFNQGENVFSIFQNSLCTDVQTTGSTKTLTLKAGSTKCDTTAGITEVLAFKGGSISLTENGTQKVVEFKDAVYTPWSDSANLYTLTGKIVLDQVSSNVTKYTVKEPLKLQIYDKDDTNKSLEYLGLQDYEYKITDADLISISSKGVVVGQPKNANFSYTFNFEITKPFEKKSWQLYPNAGGTLVIFDSYVQKIKIQQVKDQSSSADVSFNDRTPTSVTWLNIIQKK